MTAIGAQTITILRPPGRDLFGDPLPDPPAEIEVAGCSVQPDHSREDATGGRDTVTTTLTAWLPPGTDICSTDQVRHDGRVYAVDGAPARWVDLSGREHHVQVRLRVIEG
jgi:hypothetical protein